MRDLDPMMEQQILASVMQDHQMKNAKAPAVTQEEAKYMFGDESSMPSNTQVPNMNMTQMQKEKDKSHQQVIRDYMKKREALAKNSEDKARIMGDQFQGQTDLSPLMSLSDSWFGGNLSKGYKAPETRKENMAAQQTFENQARSEYGKLTDDEMNLLRQELMSEQYQAKREMGREKMDLQRQKLSQKGSSLKPLSEGLLKRLDYSEDGMEALTRMRKAVIAGDTMRPDIPLVADNNFTEALRDAAENYGRMQSGGAINKDEEARFVKTVWKMGDTREDVFRKIDKQMRMFKGRKERVLSGGRSTKKTITETYNGPEVGSQKGGYKFLGGDPNDQKSWGKV